MYKVFIGASLRVLSIVRMIRDVGNGYIVARYQAKVYGGVAIFFEESKTRVFEGS